MPRRVLTRSIEIPVVLAVLVTLVLALGASSSSIDQGRELYRIYCRSCHGEEARGDGPTAEVLKVRPTDLTRLGKGNGEKFPSREEVEAIDGRAGLVSHGTREMPIWGLAFQQFDTDVDQTEQIRSRLQSLVLYLESIQGTASVP